MISPTRPRSVIRSLSTRTIRITILVGLVAIAATVLLVVALAAVLPDVRVETLPGQAHEGMTTAPGMYAEAVTRFLLG